MKDALAGYLAIAVERGWAKEGLCVEHDSGNWVANSHVGEKVPEARTLKTPEVFRVVVVRLEG